MRTIDDGDVLREYNTRDLVDLFQAEILDLHKSEVDDWEADLMTSQYAYVKFGLLLEQVRNGCWWNRCVEKFSDFRSFCQKKVNLNIWQVTNAIKSANVAVRLAFLGFTELPRNASQALKMADLSIERLGEVWGNVIKSCEGHKITAMAIESQINPDKQPANETLKLPKRVADALRGQAIAVGMTLNQYLEELASSDEDNSIEPTQDPIIELNSEMSAIIDRVEYQWLKPQKALESISEQFDNLMNSLIGDFMPPRKSTYRREFNE